MKIWLDDERPVPDGWTGVKSADEAIHLLIECLIDGTKVTEMSLDHDLGDESIYGNGYKVLEWVHKEVYLNGYQPPEKMRVHSANVPAKKRMESVIMSIEYFIQNGGEGYEN